MCELIAGVLYTYNMHNIKSTHNNILYESFILYASLSPTLEPWTIRKSTLHVIIVGFR